MASVSAAVTVFGRQAESVCWCDTDKIYLAADATSPPVSQCVTERHKQPISVCNSDKQTPDLLISLPQSANFKVIWHL